MGLLHGQIIRDIYFQTGNHQDSLRDAEAANELNPTSSRQLWEVRNVSCAIIIIIKKRTLHSKVIWSYILSQLTFIKRSRPPWCTFESSSWLLCHDFPLWWEFYFELDEDLNAVNAQQNFSRSILVSFCSVNEVVVSDMFSHCLAVLKRNKDLT